MTGFSVDPGGLNGLYNLLARAADAAYDTLDYTRRQCDLPWNAEGLLMILLGPHEHAYANVTGALARLHELAQDTGTAVNAAQNDYLRTDRAVAARLDAVRGVPAPGPADVPSRPAGFADVADPARFLTAPAYPVPIVMWSINPLEDLLSPAAWLRQIAIWLFGHDPFEGWAKQFSGDWNAYVHCGAALARAGASVHDIGGNLVAGAAEVGTVWRGDAADREREYQVALGSAATGLQAACTAYSGLYAQAAEVTKSLFDVAGDLIGDLFDLLIVVNAAAAVGTAMVETGIGAIAGYGIAAYYAVQAYELYQKIARFYSIADDMIKAIGASVGAVRAELAVRDLPALPR